MDSTGPAISATDDTRATLTASRPCPPPAVGRGATVWTASLQWGLVSGDQIIRQYGSSGQLGRPAQLTVRRAGASHCCVDCGHDIPRGALYGATLTGLLHYCGCCTTATRPQDEFRRGAA